MRLQHFLKIFVVLIWRDLITMYYKYNLIELKIH